MRPQEVVGLRPIDLDMSDPECWVYKPDRHKGEHHERERIVFIGPRAIEVLRPFLGLDISSCVFSPCQGADEHQAGRAARRKSPVQASRKGRVRTRNRRIGDHYTVGTCRQAIQRACDRAGIPRWHPHSLRHTAGTQIRGQYGLEASQAVLGHSELRTTQIYSEKNLDEARRVMREIG
jgi:integrase